MTGCLAGDQKFLPVNAGVFDFLAADARRCHGVFARMSRSLFMAMAVGLVHLSSSPAMAQSGDAGASHCQAIYNEVWELRAKGKDGAANSLHGRARHLGCFEPPISDSLCPILDQQELLREAEGNSGLAGVIRAQQRRFLCP